MYQKSKARSVRWHKVKEIDTKPFTGNKSPYWEWVKRFGLSGRNGELREFQEANPDILPDGEPQNTPDIDTRGLMLEALKRAKLSNSEKRVLQCLGMEGLTEEATAERLGISRRSVRTLLVRAKTKCEKVFVAILGDSGAISGGQDK